MSKRDYGALVALLFIVAFIVFSFTSVTLLHTEESEVITVEEFPIEVPQDEEFTDFVTDFYTKCESAEQFGVDFIHTIHFTDYDVTMTECYTQLDNKTRNAHSVILQPSYSMEMWFNDTTPYNYVTLSNSETLESTDWVPVNYDKCDGNVSEFIKQQYKHVSNLQTVEKLLSFTYDTAEYTCTDCNEFTKIVYKSDNLPADLFNSILGSTELVDNYSIVCVLHKTTPYVVKVNLSTNYVDNEYGITGETYKYSITFTDEYYLDLPEIVTTKTSDIADIELVYNSIMTTEVE